MNLLKEHRHRRCLKGLNEAALKDFLEEHITGHFFKVSLKEHIKSGLDLSRP